MEKKFCFRSLNFIIKPLWGHDGLICLLHTCVPEARTRAVCCSLNDTPLLLQCFAVVVHKLYKLNQCAYKRFWHVISCRPHAAAQIVVMRLWWYSGVVWRQLRRLWALFPELNLCSLKVSRSPCTPPPPSSPLCLWLRDTGRSETQSLAMNMLNYLADFKVALSREITEL